MQPVGGKFPAVFFQLRSDNIRHQIHHAVTVCPEYDMFQLHHGPFLCTMASRFAC